MKTGKIHTQGEYNQEPDKHINFAEGNDNSSAFTLNPGQVRINKDDQTLELFTRRGWRAIMTQDQISDDPDRKLKDGIGEKIQTAKRTGVVGLYCQGSTNDTGIDDYTTRPGGGAIPGWMTNQSEGTGMDFNKQLVNEGTNVYLFRQNASSSTVGINNFQLVINVPEFLNIADADKYNWRYFAMGGLSGYCIDSIMAQATMDANINVFATHDAPSPDFTNINDTSPNYGQFTATLRYKYGSPSTSAFNAIFNILFIAKKFKGFE